MRSTTTTRPSGLLVKLAGATLWETVWAGYLGNVNDVKDTMSSLMEVGAAVLGLIAFASLVAGAPFLLYYGWQWWSYSQLRPSVRLWDLFDDLYVIHNMLTASSVSADFDLDVELRRKQGQLRDLGIPAPPIDDPESWKSFLADLITLAERRKLCEARCLWQEA